MFTQEFSMKVHCSLFMVICAACFSGQVIIAQVRPSVPVTVTVDTNSHGYSIPTDFVGLGFETASELPNHYGVAGYFFSSSNRQLITLFRNIGIKEIRVGGGTVDGSGSREHCATPIPTHQDIDNLFHFAQAAGIKILYSFRLLNPSACANPDLASKDAQTAAYIWSKYRLSVDAFAIGNEPDVRSFHSYPGHPLDPAVYEAVSGTAGSAYPSYLADWRHFTDVVHKAVSDAKFAGPDTAVSAFSSYTPNPSIGISWTQKFVEDEKPFGFVAEATQHHYVWGSPGQTTIQEAIDNMLSPAWVNDTSVGMQSAGPGKMTDFHPYPFVYAHILAPVASRGVPYRMTEANDCLHGVAGASNGYASALWALDYMHWWAAHGMAGVNFHNNPWIPTDTIVPSPNPCPPSGCRNYITSPKGYGMKAFDLGGHGYVEPVTISNPDHLNLTAYAVGDAENLYVTIVNKSHNSTHDTADAVVTIRPRGSKASSAASIILTGGAPGNAASLTATIGGASIPNNGRWMGKWTPLPSQADGQVVVTVPATTAVVVRLQPAGNDAGPVQMNQNGSLEIFGTDRNGEIWHNWQKLSGDASSNESHWNGWTALGGSIHSLGGVAVAKNLDNTLEVFVPSFTGDVFYKHQVTPAGSWSGWMDMGRNSRGLRSLRAANNADGSLIVFGLRANGDVWYASQNAPEVAWSEWVDLPGVPIQRGFAVAQNLSGLVEILGVDKDGNVWDNRQTSSDTWNGWSKLAGETLDPSLAIVKDPAGELAVFGIGKANGDIYEASQQYVGKSWSHWRDLGSKGLRGARIQPGFVVGQNADGSFEIAGVDSNGNVWHTRRTKSGRWSCWSSLGGRFDPQLTIASTADHRVEIFAIDHNQHVWMKWQRRPGGTWEGWTSLGNRNVKLAFQPEQTLLH